MQFTFKTDGFTRERTRRSSGRYVRGLAAASMLIVIAAGAGNAGAQPPKQTTPKQSGTELNRVAIPDFDPATWRPTAEFPLPPMESPITFKAKDDASYWFDHENKDLEKILHSRSLGAGVGLWGVGLRGRGVVERGRRRVGGHRGGVRVAQVVMGREEPLDSLAEFGVFPALGGEELPDGLITSVVAAWDFSLDIPGDTAGQQIEAYLVLAQPTKLMIFEPHLHAAGVRMCLEAIWQNTTETLTCAGYNHNWVRNYIYEENFQPLLPKGTILHAIGWFDASSKNDAIPDPRNTATFGNGSLGNMFIVFNQAEFLTDEEYIEEVKKRKEIMKANPGVEMLGCPACYLPLPDPTPKKPESSNQTN